MTESAIEIYLVKSIKSIGGMAIKLYAINNIGLPDRLVLLPDGVIFFVELKTKNGKVSLSQLNKHKAIRKLGFKVYVVNSKMTIDKILKQYTK